MIKYALIGDVMALGQFLIDQVSDIEKEKREYYEKGEFNDYIVGLIRSRKPNITNEEIICFLDLIERETGLVFNGKTFAYRTGFRIKNGDIVFDLVTLDVDENTIFNRKKRKDPKSEYYEQIERCLMIIANILSGKEESLETRNIEVPHKKIYGNEIAKHALRVGLNKAIHRTRGGLESLVYIFNTLSKSNNMYSTYTNYIKDAYVYEDSHDEPLLFLVSAYVTRGDELYREYIDETKSNSNRKPVVYKMGSKVNK